MPIEPDTLVVTKNGQEVKSVPLSDEVTIGRHPTTTVQLEDHQMSRVHLRILRQQGRYFAVDNRSTNGTLVNGKRIAPDAPIALDAESVVRCACFELRLKLHVEEASGDTKPIPRPDLVIHGACFGLLSLLAWWSGWFGPVERGATAWRVLGAGLVFAAGTEVAQGALPMLGRHGAVDDFLADVLGVVLGLVPAWWMSARGAGAQRVRA